MTYTIGVDIGGTFSDCVAVDDRGHVHHGKALSTHGTSPVEGVLAGLAQLAENAGESLESLLASTVQFSHGTTIGTNLIVERKGARVGLVATKGHGDALLMMRGRGRSAGESAEMILNVRDTDKPAPLVPRQLVAEVTERVVRDGSVLVPLDEDSARAAVTALLDRGVEAISVALLWSFRNPAHERRIREIVQELAPGVYVSISSDTAPRQGEYERTVATVINSYLGPASSRYLDELAGVLADRGLRSRPFIMQGNGGVIPVEVAGRRPVQTIGSGPAGGLAGTADIAARAGHRNVIATDMGGTSFEVGLLVAGRPVLSSENIVDKYTFRIPHLDLRSIACGGGSIARAVRGGGLQVGPDSAGSVPGPACYGRGTEATVTDADLVLGLLDAERFLDGRMVLDEGAAAAVVGRLADALGLSPAQTAAGILRVNGHNAATLIRQRTIEQGIDPRDFTLYAFGGAGPVHAFLFAAELGVHEVVIPMGNGASTLSAYGIAASDAMQVFERECTVLAPFDGSTLAAVTAGLERQALGEMTAAGFDRGRIGLARSALARYAGQYMQELVLPMTDADVDDEVGKTLEVAFMAEYARLYGDAALSPFHVPEIFSIRVAATVRLDGAATATAARGQAVESTKTRPVFWPGDGGWTDTTVYDGPPPPGHRIEGPALVQLPHTTISVAAGWQVTTDQIGNCVLTAKEQR